MTDDITRRRIVDMTRRGLSANHIATAVGLSARQVQRIRVATGTAKPPITRIPDHIAEQAKHMLDDGCSYAETARTLGCSATGLKGRLPGYTWSTQQVIDHAVFCRRHQGLLK